MQCEWGYRNTLSHHHYVWMEEWMISHHRCTSTLSYHALALVFLLFFMNGLTHFLILRGSMKQDTNLLHMCSYSTCCWKILLTVVCVPTASREVQAFCPGISTPNWTHCVYTKLVKRHKAAVQNTAMNSMLLVFSCILVLQVQYISCWMTFKVDSLLLFISYKNGLSDYWGKLNK